MTGTSFYSSHSNRLNMNAVILLFILFVSALASIDDDDLEEPVIPFCRQGQGQSTLTMVDAAGVVTEKIMVFGGKGINYKRPGSFFLGDLWELNIRGTSTERQPVKYHFDWTEIYPGRMEQWPTRRWNFASTTVKDTSSVHSFDRMIVFGGENDIIECYIDGDEAGDSQDSVHHSHVDMPLLGDLWVLLNGSNWLQLSTGWKNECPNSYESSFVPSPSSSSSMSSKRLLHHTEAASDAGSADKEYTPGPRKGAALVTLPLTNSVLLFGGYGVGTGKFTRRGSGGTNTTSSSTGPDRRLIDTVPVDSIILAHQSNRLNVSTPQPHTAYKRTNRLSKRRDQQQEEEEEEEEEENDKSLLSHIRPPYDSYTSRSKLICLTDLYRLNDISPVVDAILREEQRKNQKHQGETARDEGGTGTGTRRRSSKDNNSNSSNYSNYTNDTDSTSDSSSSSSSSSSNGNKPDVGVRWQRMVQFPGRCLSGFAAVGVVDSYASSVNNTTSEKQSLEKLMVFGGQYADSDHNGMGRYSSDIYLFEPISQTWDVFTHAHAVEANLLRQSAEKTAAGPTGGGSGRSGEVGTLGADGERNTMEEAQVAWPLPKFQHQMVFVAERNSVFVSGGATFPDSGSTTRSSMGRTGSSGISRSGTSSNKSDNNNANSNNNKGNGLDDDDDNNDSLGPSQDPIKQAQVDLWEFHLPSRSWYCHNDGSSRYSTRHSSSEAARATLHPQPKKVQHTLQSATPRPPQAQEHQQHQLHDTAVTGADTGMSGASADLFPSLGSSAMQQPSSRLMSSLSLLRHISLNASFASNRISVEINNNNRSGLYPDTLTPFQLVMFGGRRVESTDLFGSSSSRYMPSTQRRHLTTALRRCAHTSSSVAHSIVSASASASAAVRNHYQQAEEEQRRLGELERHTVVDMVTSSQITFEETNDLWLYSLSGRTGRMSSTGSEYEGDTSSGSGVSQVSSTSSSTSSTGNDDPTTSLQLPEEYWVLLSRGGCHEFDDGRNIHHKVDTTAVIVVSVVIASILLGLLLYKCRIHSHLNARLRGYSNLSDDSHTSPGADLFSFSSSATEGTRGQQGAEDGMSERSSILL